MDEFKTDFAGFKMRAKELLDKLPSLDMKQMGNGFHCLGITYLETDFKNDNEQNQAAIVLELVNKKIMDREMILLRQDFERE